MPSAKLDATLTVYYEDEWFGHPWLAPEAVVLIHGAAESSRAWFAWVPRLAGELRVLRPDLRGFGRSTVPPAGYPWSPRAFAADLARFFDVLGLAAAHVVGAKLGGTVALQFAADYPQRTRTLAVLSGPVRGHGAGGKIDPGVASARIGAVGLAAWAAETQRARLGSSVSSEQVEWWTQLMAQSDARVCLEVTAAAGRMDISDLLPQIRCPALVITTEGSSLLPVETVREWQRQIPTSELLVLPGDSFHPAASVPDECARHVLAFIGRRAAPAGHGGS